MQTLEFIMLKLSKTKPVSDMTLIKKLTEKMCSVGIALNPKDKSNEISFMRINNHILYAEQYHI